MKLRFAVNQAESFRRGVDAPKSTATVDVDPATLSQEERDLIADRMEGIDVCRLTSKNPPQKDAFLGGGFGLVEAFLPTFEALMEAIRANEEAVQANEKRIGTEAGRIASASEFL